jgi:hypothetical protein
MNPICAQISLADAVAGMILADDLRDSNTNVLLPCGATLTEAALISLRRHNIESLHVLTETQPAADSEFAREHQRQRLAKLFRATDDNGANALLRQHIMQYRLGENHA